MCFQYAVKVAANTKFFYVSGGLRVRCISAMSFQKLPKHWCVKTEIKKKSKNYGIKNRVCTSNYALVSGKPLTIFIIDPDCDVFPEFREVIRKT